MIREKLDTQITFSFKQTYLNETLLTDILFLHDMDYDDGMIRIKLTYEYHDDVYIYVGSDVFYGNKEGLFGQFNEIDRINSGIIIDF